MIAFIPFTRDELGFYREDIRIEVIYTAMKGLEVRKQELNEVKSSLEVLTTSTSHRDDLARLYCSSRL
jgi:predicted RNA-binding protein